MKFKIDQGSNVVSIGQPINLIITVVADSEEFFLQPKKYVSLKNLDFLENTGVKVTFKKGNDIQGELRKINAAYQLLIRDEEPFKFFQIQITSEKPLADALVDGKATLQVGFFESVEGGSEVKLDFIVVEQTSPIEIVKFDAKRTIIQKNNGPLELEYEISGYPDEAAIWHNGKWIVLNLKGKSKGEAKVNFSDPEKYPVNRNHYFTLHLKKGDQQVAKSVCIIYVDSSLTATRDISSFKLDGNDIKLTLLNMCASEDSTCLFALFGYEVNGTYALVLGYTYHIDGNNWHYVEIVDEKDVLGYFINSPMVHLKSKGKSLGQILFIGGSKVELNNRRNHKVYAGHIGRLDLDDEKKIFTTESMKLKDSDEDLGSVWGHTCIVGNYPETKLDQTILRFGGVNKSGNGYDNFYSSTDGVEWSEVNNTNKVLSKRAALSATFELNEQGDKSTIWIGGGVKEFGDTSIIKGEFNVAKDENNTEIGVNWTNTIDRLVGKKILLNTSDSQNFEKLFAENNQLKCFAIAAYSIPNGSDTGLVLIGLNEEGWKFSRGISTIGGKLKITKYDIISHDVIKDIKPTHTGVINTAFVNGCLFFTVVYSGGANGVTYSPLYYYIPVIPTTTIAFNKK